VTESSRNGVLQDCRQPSWSALAGRIRNILLFADAAAQIPASVIEAVNPPASHSRRFVRAFAVAALSASACFIEVAQTSAGTVDNFTGTSLSGSSYTSTPISGTAYNNGSDVDLTTSTSALTINGTVNVNMESLYDPGTKVGTITNTTSGATSTLTLGNNFGFTNANNTSAAVPDLIYIGAAGSKNLTIGGGAGTLNIVLASSGNIDNAATGAGSNGVTFTISSNIGDGGNGFGLNISGTAPDPVVFTGTNTYSGGTTVSAGELDVAGDASLGAVPTTATTDITVNGGELSSVSGNSFTIGATRTILLGSSASTLFGVKGTGSIVTYNGSFQDLTTGGVLTKQGAGTLLLGGNSTQCCQRSGYHQWHHRQHCDHPFADCL
jgi:autotransporter-associated beta strand protein